MTDSESEGGPVLRRSERQRSPTKKIQPYEQMMEGLKQRREESERKKTVAKKRQTGLKLVESSQSKLSPVPEQLLSDPKASQFTGRDSDSRTPTKEKGKGRAEDPQSVQAVAKGGRIISPDKESRPKGPGPRLGSSDHFDDDVEAGEFDNEPAPRKPLAVRAIDAPESLPAKSQSANDRGKARKSRSSTNLFLQKRRADEENQDGPPNKRHQHESSVNPANFRADPDLRHTVRNGESTLERPLPSTSQAAQPQPLSRSTDSSGRGESGNSREVSVTARLPAPSKQTVSKPLPLTQDSSRRLKHNGNGAGSVYRGHTQVPDCRSPPPISRPCNPPELGRPGGSSRPRSRSPGRRVADTATAVDRQRGDSQLGPGALSPRRRLPSPRRRSPAPRRRSLSPRRGPNLPQRLELPQGHPQAPHYPSSTPHHPTSDVPRPRDPQPRQSDTQTSAQSSSQQRRTGPTAETNERRSSARSDLKQSTQASSSTNSRRISREKASNSRASKSSAGRSRSKQKSTGKPRSKSRRGNRRGKRTRESTEEEEESDEADDKDEDADNRDVVKSVRGRLKHFFGVEKSILIWAIRAYKAIMVVSGMYEADIDTVDQRRLEAWEIGLKKYNKTREQYPLSMAHIQCMNDCLVTWRSHAKSYVQGIAAAEYFPKNQEMTPAELEAHIKMLKAGGLHTKPGSDPGHGCFQHSLIQTCMDEMLFRHKNDIGVQFADLFQEPTVQLVCFFCAVLQFIVEERESGKTGSGELDFEAQRKAYGTHLASHAVWLIKSEPRWKLIQKQLFVRAFKQSGAHESAIPTNEKSVFREEDLEPDDPDQAELEAWERELAELKDRPQTAERGWGGLDDGDMSDRDERYNDNEQDRQNYEHGQDRGGDHGQGQDYDRRQGEDRNLDRDRDHNHNHDHDRNRDHDHDHDHNRDRSRNSDRNRNRDYDRDHSHGYDSNYNRDYDRDYDRRRDSEYDRRQDGDDLQGRNVDNREQRQRYNDRIDGPRDMGSCQAREDFDRATNNTCRNEDRHHHRERGYPERSRHDSTSRTSDTRPNYGHRNSSQDHGFQETHVRDDYDWQLPPSNQSGSQSVYIPDRIGGGYRVEGQPRVWYYRDYLGGPVGTHSPPQYGDRGSQQYSARSDYGDDHDNEGNARKSPMRRNRSLSRGSGELSDWVS